MGKKKSNKTDREKVISVSDVENDSIKKKVLIIVIVIVCLIVFYLLAVYLTKNDTSSVKSNKDKDVNAVIDYDKIIIGQSFTKGNDYYVIYYDASDDVIKNDVTSVISSYRSANENVKVYEVDMSSAFNSGYSTTDETNKNPGNIDELRINGITLIKFSNGAVVDYVEGYDNIKNYLGQ